jgi:hypothetical protein
MRHVYITPEFLPTPSSRLHSAETIPQAGQIVEINQERFVIDSVNYLPDVESCHIFLKKED